MSLRPRTVRLRLTAWYALVLAASVGALSATTFVLVRSRLLAELDARLARDLAAVEATYRESPGEIAEAESRSGIRLFEISESGGAEYQTRAWIDEGLDRALPGPGGASATSWRSPGGARFRVAAMEDRDHRVVVAADEGAVAGTLTTLRTIFLLGVPMTVVLAIAGGWFLAGRVLAPVGAMAERARRIGASSLEERLPVGNPGDEFGRLATVFNETLARLHDAFGRLRRFTADASHELRTPLTAIRSVGEVALQRSLDAPAYRNVISSMLEEVGHLTSLVESLLSLTRLDAGRGGAKQEDIHLAELASRSVEQLRVLADERTQLLDFRPACDARVSGDPELIRRGIVNVLDNAIKYTPAGGRITVSVQPAGLAEAAVEVEDDGPGISPAEQTRVFDRFYRANGAHADHRHGLGLGLAIARAAIELHGGRIELESEVGRGSRFRIVLPCLALR